MQLCCLLYGAACGCVYCRPSAVQPHTVRQMLLQYSQLPGFPYTCLQYVSAVCSSVQLWCSTSRTVVVSLVWQPVVFALLEDTLLG